jgi:hypothetical protein
MHSEYIVDALIVARRNGNKQKEEGLFQCSWLCRSGAIRRKLSGQPPPPLLLTPTPRGSRNILLMENADT